jgi:hypothetical protein
VHHLNFFCNTGRHRQARAGGAMDGAHEVSSTAQRRAPPQAMHKKAGSSKGSASQRQDRGSGCLPPLPQTPPRPATRLPQSRHT